MRDLSRRDFLKGSAAGLAGVAAANIFGLTAFAAGKEDDKKEEEKKDKDKVDKDEDKDAKGDKDKDAKEEAGKSEFNATSNDDGLVTVDTDSMEKLTADVAVIGGGGAGISAAIAAAEAGKEVILLEKIGYLGGTTILSGGIIPAVGTDEQIEYGVTDDTVAANARDILRPSNYSVRQDLVYTVAEKGKEMVEWLRDMGVKWTLMDSLFYGQSEHRMHLAEGGGNGMTTTMIEHLESLDNVTIMLDTTVEGLLVEDGTVIGCYGKDKDDKAFALTATNTVMATTGFGNNEEMLKKYCPEIVPAIRIVSPGATGEGIRWGEQLGAKLANMGAYQGYAFHTVDNNKSGEQGVLNNGGIFVNEQGKRFCNEYGGYSELTPHILAQSNNICYVVFNDIQKEKSSSFEAWEEADIVFKGETVKELAEAIGVDADALEKTIETYKEGIKAGEDVFNRCKLPENFDGPYYAVKNTGEIRHTQGGMAIDIAAHVLKEDGTLIPGLYAAGGCTEGFSSGAGAAYMSGNGLLQALIFGKIAGENAAKETPGKAKVATWEYSDKYEKA